MGVDYNSLNQEEKTYFQKLEKHPQYSVLLFLIEKGCISDLNYQRYMRVMPETDEHDIFAYWDQIWNRKLEGKLNYDTHLSYKTIERLLEKLADYDYDAPALVNRSIILYMVYRNGEEGEFFNINLRKIINKCNKEQILNIHSLFGVQEYESLWALNTFKRNDKKMWQCENPSVELLSYTRSLLCSETYGKHILVSYDKMEEKKMDEFLTFLENNRDYLFLGLQKGEEYFIYAYFKLFKIIKSEKLIDDVSFLLQDNAALEIRENGEFFEYGDVENTWKYIYENGKYIINEQNVMAICEYYGVSEPTFVKIKTVSDCKPLNDDIKMLLEGPYANDVVEEVYEKVFLPNVESEQEIIELLKNKNISMERKHNLIRNLTAKGEFLDITSAPKDCWEWIVTEGKYAYSVANIIALWRYYGSRNEEELIEKWVNFICICKDMYDRKEMSSSQCKLPSMWDETEKEDFFVDLAEFIQDGELVEWVCKMLEIEMKDYLAS